MPLSIPKDVLVRIRANSAELERAGTRGQAALRRIGSGAAAAAKSVLAVGAAAVGIGYTIKRGLLDPFEEQERSLASLGASLASTGKVGVQAIQSIADEAARLQRLTKFGDEGLIEGVSTLAALAPQLKVDELVTAQQALVGIATVFTKGDVESAASLLGKTLGSATNALARYGIQVDPAATASEKLAQIVGSRTLGAAFNVAQAQAQTLGGRLAQLNNALGDTRELGGEVVARALGLGDATGGLVQKVQDLNDRIAANMDRWVAWTRVGVESLQAVGVSLFELVRITWNVGNAIGRILDLAFQSLVVAFKVAMNGVVAVANGVLDQVNRLPGLDIQFRFSEFDAARSIDYFRLQARNLKGDVDQIGRSTSNLVDRWFDVADAVATAQNTAAGNSRPLAQASVSGAGAGGGGLFEGLPGVTGPNLRTLNPLEVLGESTEETDRRLRYFWAGQRLLAYDFAEAVEVAGRKMEYLTDIGVEFGNLFAGALAGAVDDGLASFTRFRDQVLAMLAQIAARFAVFQLLSLIPGLGGVATAFGTASGFLEARASGGPVISGRPYLVGERGPEVFVPNSAGGILPNGGLRAQLSLSNLPPARDPLSMARDGQWLRALETSLIELRSEGVST